MEKLVHTGSILPPNFLVVRITLPDDKSLYEIAVLCTLPDGWNVLTGSSAAAAYDDEVC
jgi:hypothetical protein